MSFDEIQREFGVDLSGFMLFINANIDFRTEEALEKQIYSGKIKTDYYTEQEQFREKFQNDLLANGREKQFSKGFERLRTWLNLAYKEHSQLGVDKYGKPNVVKTLTNPLLDKSAKFYALAGLMVIFQVFGDGNHRTASKYFKQNAGRELRDEEKNLIEDFNRTYNWHGIIISQCPPAIIDEIVENLTSKFNYMNRCSFI